MKGWKTERTTARHSAILIATGRRVCAIGACIFILGLAPLHADAACNLIPGTAKTFNADLGAANRPFAAPGESLELTVRDCDDQSLGLGPNATDQIVTIIFKPPNGLSNAVVLTADADCTAIDSQLASCAAEVGGQATCVAAAAQTSWRSGSAHSNPPAAATSARPPNASPSPAGARASWSF